MGDVNGTIRRRCFRPSVYIFATYEGVSAPAPKWHTGSVDITH